MQRVPVGAHRTHERELRLTDDLQIGSVEAARQFVSGHIWPAFNRQAEAKIQNCSRFGSGIIILVERRGQPPKILSFGDRVRSDATIRYRRGRPSGLMGRWRSVSAPAALRSALD
jgi:hypothetical protein